ncbi:putative glutathione peroxidase 8 [Takifugu flavidus]|uniref:Putative glutathione peroxidase 8 n=1 Tax=Takifugu flavidus TaxID=433684 RepID=A0A5C6MZJ9_9TELE|nr:putative glutathione peroxidase 8 [Takifugu flavidus]
MEALGGYPTRSSNPKAKKLTVLLSMTVGVGCLFLLQTQLLKPRRPSDFYSFEVKDAKGRTVSLEKYRENPPSAGRSPYMSLVLLKVSSC